MQTPGAKKGQNQPLIRKNPFESYNDSSQSSFGKKLVNDTFSGINDTFGTGLLDNMFGIPKNQDQDFGQESPFGAWGNEYKQPPKPKLRIERTIFNGQSHHETHVVPKQIQEMKQAVEQVRQEMKILKNEATALVEEAKDVDNALINSGSEKGQVYDMSFLQLAISLIRSLRERVHKSRNCLSMFKGRQQKKGAYASRKQKSGTAYTESNELKLTRTGQ